MTSAALQPRTPQRHVRTDRAGAAFLILGGIAFFLGGGLHPKDSGSGDKLAQLHDMLVSSMWYPAHAVLLAAMALIAAGIIAIRRHGQLEPGLGRLVGVVAAISVLATFAMLVHLFAATEASAIAGGDTTFMIQLVTWNETIINPIWALAIAALALAGGLTRTVGNRIVMALGVVGGSSFALATATIAYTDTFYPLFPLSSLLGIWAVAVGVIWLKRHA
jgi:hypothetical protein